jgi:hypothetical protein
MIDQVALATITASATVLGNEFLKGIAGEAGKSTWLKIKSLFGWEADPTPAELPEKIASSLVASPELANQLLALLKQAPTNEVSAMVGKLEVSGGKVTVVGTMQATTISF